jgi:hypothetical protein
MHGGPADALSMQGVGAVPPNRPLKPDRLSLARIASATQAGAPVQGRCPVVVWGDRRCRGTGARQHSSRLRLVPHRGARRVCRGLE